MNLLMTLVDWTLAGWRFNPKHFPLVVMWVGLYMCWHLIGNAAYGIMCYPFMATNHVSFIWTNLGMLVLVIVIYFIYCALDLVKHRFCNCCLVRPGLLNVDELTSMSTTKLGSAAQEAAPAEIKVQ